MRLQPANHEALTRKIGTTPSGISPELKAALQQIGIINPDAVSTKQAAAYLSLVKGVPTAPSSLEVYRSKSRGAKYKKIGSRVFYTTAWLDEYAEGVEVKIFDPSQR